MSAEAVINAIGNIDEELINSCDELRSSYVPKPISYGKWISIAACLLLVSAAGLTYMLNIPEMSYVELSGNEWWKHKNPITYTERPEKEQVAIRPTDTPEPTEAPTLLPTEAPIETGESQIEINKEPMEEEINWKQYIAGLTTEKGGGADEHPGTRSETVDISIVPSGKFIGSAGQWVYSIIFGGSEYIARSSKLLGEDIGACLGEYSLSGYEEITDALFTDTAFVYEIKNVSTEAALAVEVEGNYYVFINKYYTSHSLLEFIEDFNLMNNTVITELVTFNEADGSVSGRYNVQDGMDVWNILIKNESYTIDYKSLEDKSDINMGISSYIYGFSDMSVALYDEGYIYFYLLGVGQAYYIGEDAVNDIKNMLAEMPVADATQETFGATIYDAETGETYTQYYDIKTGNEDMSTDAWFPNN